MKKISALISIVILILGYANGQTTAQLEQAYQEKSTEKLNTFFNDWAKDLTPATPVQRSKMSKPVQQAYRIFEAFYNPHDLSSQGGSQMGNKLYEGLSYLIIQDKFKIYQKDKVFYTDEEAKAYAIENIRKNVEEKYREKIMASINSGRDGYIIYYGPNQHEWNDTLRTLIDSVTSFRPNIIQTKATPLYLTSKYSALLNNFIGNRYEPVITGESKKTTPIKNESTDRQKFLENYIKVFPSFWSNRWLYCSYPVISSIVFDKHLKYAKVYYGIRYEGGEAFFKFENNVWKLLSAKRTWIE